ncbi:DUF4113 domain-containing protein [Kosakonia cowanii]
MGTARCILPGQMKRERLSPRYTTRLSGLLVFR